MLLSNQEVHLVHVAQTYRHLLNHDIRLIWSLRDEVQPDEVQVPDKPFSYRQQAC